MMDEAERRRFWPNLWRCYGLAWLHPKAALATLLLSAAIGGLTALLLLVLDQAIELIADAEKAMEGDTLEPLQRTAAGMRMLAWQVLPLAPLAGLAAWASWFGGQWVANRAMLTIRARFLDHLIALDLAFHASLTKGDLLSRLSADMVTMQNVVQLLFSKLLQRTLEIIGLLVVLYFVNVPLALGLTILAVPVALILGNQFKRARKRSVAARETLGDTVGVLEQVTSGIRVIKAMGSDMRERERYDEINRDLLAKNMKVARSRAQADATSNFLAFALFGGAMLGGSFLFVERLITPSDLVVFLGAMGRLATLARTTQRAWGEVIEQVPSAERIFAILDRPAAITDRPDAGEAPMPANEISVDHVTFRYDPTGEPVLEDCSLSIPVGQTVALVGESGAGKSTLLDLLPRFHDVEAGAIRIDGVDIRDCRFESLISRFAIVQQDSFLFNDTVFANIAYGRPGATREEVEQAAKRAHVHDAIMALEGGKGYDSPVGDRGDRLSGGQRQRVAIARALLRDAPILLLDEPTSALDAESERHVQEALSELMRGRTCIVVAHRLATIQHADRIFVCARERRGVIESGTHRELIDQGGEYARLVRLQQLER